MADIDVDVRAVDPQHVATLTRSAPSIPEVGPVVGPIFPEVSAALDRAGLLPGSYGPAVAEYLVAQDGSVDVKAGFVVPDTIDAVAGAEIRTLGAVEAAVTVHHGDMSTISDTWNALMTWISANGYEYAGNGREVYWSPPDLPQSEWVTDIVQPVRRAASV